MKIRSQALKPIFSSDGSIIGYAQKGSRRGLVTYDQNFEVIGGAQTEKCARMLAVMHDTETVSQPAHHHHPLAEPPLTRSIDYRRPTIPFGSEWELSCS